MNNAIIAKDGTPCAGINITSKTFHELLRGRTIVIELGSMGLPKSRLIIIGSNDPDEGSKRLTEKLAEETGIIVPVRSVLRGDQG